MRQCKTQVWLLVLLFHLTCTLDVCFYPTKAVSIVMFAHEGHDVCHNVVS